ncbi:MAG: hypothetical protein ATN35_02715 [Epulopiscium sp. Nele67-Bin004]|nr:MAG: hypothetical protein ATN35_02715 [Epulopiscium sp. Nele67-Bin004]
MTGVSENEFGASETANRATLAAILQRMSSTPTASATNGFSDVVSGAWYEGAVNWAVSAGIYGGFEDGTFRPNDDITREQLVAILFNFAAYEGYSLTGSTSITSFADGGEVSSWAAPAMQWAVGNGIVGGKDGNALDPKGTATRAEIASIITRFMNNIN